MPRIETYLDEPNGSPFGRWFEALDAPARAKVTAVLYRMEQDNAGDIKALGGGVMNGAFTGGRACGFTLGAKAHA